MRPIAEIRQLLEMSFWVNCGVAWAASVDPETGKLLRSTGEESLAGDFLTAREDHFGLLDMVSAASSCAACQISEIAMLADLPALIRPPQAGA
jgi:hypothetical protein